MSDQTPSSQGPEVSGDSTPFGSIDRKTAPILVVEHDTATRQVTIECLAELNLANPLAFVRSAAAAVAWLDHAAEVDLPPAVILVDLDLPDDGGVDVVRHARAGDAFPHTRVAIVTGATESDVDRMADAYEIGIDAHLVKPLEKIALCRMINRLAMPWALLAAPSNPGA